MTTAFAFEAAERHFQDGHPEHPDRVKQLRSLLPSVQASRIDVRLATMEEVGRIHTPGMIKSLLEACSQGETIIDFAPTYVTGASMETALRAAGATIDCVCKVQRGEAENAFALVRPPGHHAEPDRAMGFCLLNNVAIAAAAALAEGAARLAIVDFDAHHGNGTQASFVRDERVAFLSMHQWGIYPGTGWFEEAGEARSRIVNVPLPARTGNAAYARIADQLVAPFVRRFEPELLLVCAGFDAQWSDPITSLGLSSSGFHALSQKLVDLASEHCGGRIVFVLEGGYDPQNVAHGAMAVFAALTRSEFQDPLDTCPYPEPDTEALLHTILKHHAFTI